MPNYGNTSNGRADLARMQSGKSSDGWFYRYCEPKQDKRIWKFYLNSERILNKRTLNNRTLKRQLSIRDQV